MFSSFGYSINVIVITSRTNHLVSTIFETNIPKLLVMVMCMKNRYILFQSSLSNVYNFNNRFVFIGERDIRFPIFISLEYFWIIQLYHFDASIQIESKSTKKATIFSFCFIRDIDQMKSIMWFCYRSENGKWLHFFFQLYFLNKG